MYGYCTQSSNWGCDRTAVNGNVLNPIMSGKLTTHAAIKYGRVNVRACIPKGDWIWPGNRFPQSDFPLIHWTKLNIDFEHF